MEYENKKFLIKYKISSSCIGRSTERDYIIFSCNKDQAIYDAHQILSYFNNGRTIEIINCTEIKQNTITSKEGINGNR